MRKELRGSGSVYRLKYANGTAGPIWWIQYRAKGVKPNGSFGSILHRESSGSSDRARAEKLLRHRVAEVTLGRVVLAPSAERVTPGAMLAALKADYARKNNRVSLVAGSRHLLDFFGANARAITIRRDAISHYIAARRAQLILIRRSGILQPPSCGTINIELALLRRAFHVQVEAGNLSRDHVPVMPMCEKSKARQGFVGVPEFEQLCAALPEHLRDPIRFLYLSGWRKNEMQTVEWRDCELRRDEQGALVGGTIRLRPERSKNKRARALPLSGDLKAIIERADAQRTPACPFVFTHDGAPLGSFRKSWATACKASGLARLLVHDLRRSAVRNLVRAGIPESVAMGFTGHLTRTVFDKYDVVDSKDLEAAAEKMQSWVRERALEPPKVVALRKMA
jgi:integrase